MGRSPKYQVVQKQDVICPKASGPAGLQSTEAVMVTTRDNTHSSFGYGKERRVPKRGNGARAGEREDTMRRWQEEWTESPGAVWTKLLIPEIKPWMDRRWGMVNYHLTQLLSGHGSFMYYLQRFKKREESTCMYCDEVDDVRHTFFESSRCERLKMELETDVGNHVNPENITELMLESRANWERIERYVTKIVTQKGQDERSLVNI